MAQTQVVVTPGDENAAAASPNLSVSYVDWPAIFAGAVLASAIAFVLGSFGTAVGLSLVSPYEGEGIQPTIALIAVAIWMVWVAASSFMAGAYLAGRLRRRIPDATEHETDVRDGAHGLVVWAVGAIIGAALLGSGAATTVQVGTQAAATAAQAAGAVAAGGIAMTDEGDRSYLLDRMFRVPADGTSTGDEPEPGTYAEAARIMAANVDDEQMAPEDSEYLASVVSRATGLDQEEALQRVQETHANLREVATGAQAAADAARKFSVVAAFVLAASLLIGAAGAYWAAGVGGRHRDRQTVVSWFVIW